MEALLVFAGIFLYATLATITAAIFYRYNFMSARSAGCGMFGIFWPIFLSGLIVIGILWYPSFVFRKLFHMIAD